MFCSNCGNKIDDNTSFCKHCGAPTKAADRAAADAQPAMRAEAPAAVPPAGPGLPNYQQLVYKVKCPSCGHVYDAGFNSVCKKCKTPHTIDFANNGFIQLYRMGHFSGSMNAQGIYLNGEPMGHVANTGTALIELAPGRYTLHCTIGMCRNCEDLSLVIEPGKIICVKSQLKVGAIKSKILLHVVDPSEMPPM